MFRTPKVSTRGIKTKWIQNRRFDQYFGICIPKIWLVPMALFIFSINLPRVSTRGYNMFRADGPLNILSPQGLSQRTLRWFAAIYKWSTIPRIPGTRRRVPFRRPCLWLNLVIILRLFVIICRLAICRPMKWGLIYSLRKYIHHGAKDAK